MSEDMSPYCSAHDELLIMKLCMYVSDPLKLKKGFKICLRCFTGTAHHSRDAATGFMAVATRSRAGCWSMEERCRKSLINWPYQPKHSPSSVHAHTYQTEACYQEGLVQCLCHTLAAVHSLQKRETQC